MTRVRLFIEALATTTRLEQRVEKILETHYGFDPSEKAKRQRGWNFNKSLARAMAKSAAYVLAPTAAGSVLSTFYSAYMAANLTESPAIAYSAIGTVGLATTAATVYLTLRAMNYFTRKHMRQYGFPEDWIESVTS